MGWENEKEKSMFGQVGFGIMALIATDIALSSVAVVRYPALLQQHLAWIYLLEPTAILLVYGIGTIYLANARDDIWISIRRNATLFGLVTGSIELINIVIENLAFKFTSGPLVSIGFMLLVFVLWGIAAAWSARSSKSVRAGIFTAIASAGICMLIAVAGGFFVELLVAPPNPAVVSTWAEFKRSGWTDPYAFGLANALDSGSTHLLIAPVVALVFGSVSSLLSRFLSAKAFPAGA
jgi:hypothetical protein